MMEEEIRTSLGSTMSDLLAEDLQTKSLEELSQRIEALRAEIERALAMIESKKGSHSDAEALLK